MQSGFRRSFKYLHVCVSALFLALAAAPLTLAAQTHLSTDIRPTGVKGQITVSDPSTTLVSFNTVLKGNLSQYVELAANGPSGLKGYAEIRQIKRGGKLGPVFRLAFPKKKKGVTTVLVDGSSQALRSAPALRAAAGPSQEQVDRIVSQTQLSAETVRYLLRFMSEEQILAQYKKSPSTPTTPGNPSNPGGSDPTPKTEPGSLLGRGLVSKDNCDKSVEGYQLTFKIDLSGVDRAASGNSFIVSASVEAGDSIASVSSIKPVSDGKFAPRPLILMQGAGYSYGSSSEGLRVVRWKGGRPGKTTALRIEDRIYYRGQSLARAVVSDALTGGKGTFEIFNGTKVGSACFNLVRARQKANGYKGGD